MLSVSLVGDGHATVDAALITIDEMSLACWSGAGAWSEARRGADGAEPIARWPLEQVLSIRLVEPPGGRGVEADPEHPNAFRRWTAEHEEAIVAAYHHGETMEEIAAAVGRRVGGVRARLISLGVIEPGPADRLRFPGVPAMAAVAAAEVGAGEAGAGETGAGEGRRDHAVSGMEGRTRARPLLRAVDVDNGPMSREAPGAGDGPRAGDGGWGE